MSFGPRSLAGRLALVLAVALLAAQAINFALLWRSHLALREAREDLTVARFVDRVDRLSQGEEQPRLRRWLERRNALTEDPRAAAFARDDRLTAKLTAALEEAGLPADGAVSARNRAEGRDGEPMVFLHFSAQLPSGRYLNDDRPLGPSGRLSVVPLLIQTLVIYGVLLGAVLLLTRQISRPLRRLEMATREVVLARPSRRLPAEGPADIRALTESFEDMRSRIGELFAEKDVMLGAIGHDLRTPLTALRIRAESVTEDRQRDAMIRILDEMSLLLDDILSLARTGQPTEERQRVEIGAVLRALADEAAEQDQDVRVEISSSREAEIYPTLLRRALRNLIDNGLKAGPPVTLLLHEGAAGDVVVSVRDHGPGLSDEEIARLRRPFERGEGSRNRATGGAGLGLAIVDRVAALHGGTLTLARAGEGGLIATLTLPSTDQSR